MSTSVIFKTISNLIILTILLVFTTSSCKSKKTTSSEESTTTEQVNPKDNTNYKPATIVDYSDKNEACNFLILLEEDGSLLQPINIPEELRKDGTKVWISFNPSRRQQGPCPLGKSITIESIKIKE